MSRRRLANGTTAWVERMSPAGWALLAVFAVTVAARHIRPLLLLGRPDDHLVTTGDILPALPILFAAAVVFAVPRRRLLVAGAMMLAVAAVLTVGARVVLLPEGVNAARHMVVASLVVAGPRLFGHGLGGVRSRLGVGVVALALVLAVIGAISALIVRAVWISGSSPRSNSRSA